MTSDECEGVVYFETSVVSQYRAVIL